ncbi:MAG: hypothetical protein OSA92_06280, partial [Pirellulaceae bacterium]|nr:hypothetical protein [Pirellulaceae bacterium]
MVSILKHPPTVLGRASVLLWMVLLSLPQIGNTQGLFDFERPPIDYHQTIANNPITQLQAKLDQDKVKLEYSDKHGYLPGL